MAVAAAEDDMTIAESLAEMLRDARAVISDKQDLINNAQLGDKHLTGKVVLSDAAALYKKNTGVDPTKVDPQSRQGRLLHAMMEAIVEVVDENQATINEKETGFKGFIPAVFARLVAESFVPLARAKLKSKLRRRRSWSATARRVPMLGRARSSRKSCSIRLGPRGNCTPRRSKPGGGQRFALRSPSTTVNPVSPAMARRKAVWTLRVTRKRAAS